MKGARIPTLDGTAFGRGQQLHSEEMMQIDDPVVPEVPGPYVLPELAFKCSWVAE